MYRSFQVSNFRCFKHLVMNDIAQINLIAGVNNVGKTALLEALYLHSGAYNPELTLRIDAFRGIEKKTFEFAQWFKPPWETIFNEFDTAKVIGFVGKYENRHQRSLRLRVIREPTELTEIYGHFLQTSRRKADMADNINLSSGAHVLQLECRDGAKSTTYNYIFDRGGFGIFPIPPTLPYQVVFMPARQRFIAEDVSRFSRLQTAKKEQVVLEALKVVEPKLMSLSIAIDRDLPLIQGDIGIGRRVPLPLMGEGMTRLASIVLAIAEAQNGVVLIDEVENGFHYSVLPKVWELIAEAGKLFNAQIFTTTHSFECIVAAHKTFEQSKSYNFRLHRLEVVQEETRAVTYDRGTLSAALDAGFEVR